MIDVNIARSTFAAGEVADTLYARDDLARTQTALAKCENFVVLYEGGITRRPGTRFIMPLKNEAEIGALITFRYSQPASYIQVINFGVMQLIKAGGAVVGGTVTPFELAMPIYAGGDIPNIRTAQFGIAQFVAALGRRPQQIAYLGTDVSWNITPYPGVGGPSSDTNTNPTFFLIASATTGAINLTSSGFAPFLAGDEGSNWRIDADPAAVQQWKPNETGLAVGAVRRYAGNYYSNQTAAGDTGVNPPVHTTGDAASGTGNVVWRYLHSGFGFVTITNVINAATATADVFGTLPDNALGGGTSRWTYPDWRGGLWPTGVAVHQGRLGFSRNNRFWLTRAGNLYDHTAGLTDDAGIAQSLFSARGEMVALEWMISSGALVMGTRDSEWLMRGADAADPIVPTTLPFNDTQEGSATHVPEKVENGMMMIGRSGERLHYVVVDGVSGKISIREITRAARHILKGKAVRLAWQRDPNRIIWVGCLDGQLIGCTFMPDENVIAFHRHPLTNGFVEALGHLPNADESATDVYLIVRRIIGGGTHRYIEIMSPYFSPSDPANPTAAGAWFVDCGLRYQGAPATNISGLAHLEGQVVRGIADGREVGPFVVAGGAVTLGVAASDVIIGLPIVARARSLPFEKEMQDGSSKGKAKHINHATVDVLNSAGGALSANAGTFEPLAMPDDTGGPLKLATDPTTGSSACAIAVTLESQSAEKATLELVCDNALPFTLSGWTPDVTFAE